MTTAALVCHVPGKGRRARTKLDRCGTYIIDFFLLSSLPSSPSTTAAVYFLVGGTSDGKKRNSSAEGTHSDGCFPLPAGKHVRSDPIYQALWADTTDFNEVLISPVMVHDHMPDTVLRALNKVTMAV